MRQARWVIVLWCVLALLVAAPGSLVEVPAQARTEPAAEAGEPSAAPALTRLAGDGRIDTAVAVSRAAFPDGAARAVLAAAATFPDALAAAPLAAALQGPLLLTGDRTPAPVLAELERLSAEQVVIVGAVGAVPAVVQAELRRAGIDVHRIAGETRFDTAALIARELVALRGEDAGPLQEIVVASGTSAADALAAAPLAAAQGSPILLVADGVLPGDTAEVVAELGAPRTLLVGGQAAVGEDVAAGLPGVTRVAGETRYETAAAVARLALERGATADTVVLATGRDFPDALAAGPLTARSGGLLLLVDGLEPDPAAPARALLEAHAADIATLIVLGGQQAISTAVAEALAAAAASVEPEPDASPQPTSEPSAEATTEPTPEPAPSPTTETSSTVVARPSTAVPPVIGRRAEAP